MDERRPATPYADAGDLDRREGRSRLGRVFGPSWLVALAVVAVLLFALRRFVPFGPVGALILLAVVWFVVLVVMMRWRIPATRPEQTGRR